MHSVSRWPGCQCVLSAWPRVRGRESSRSQRFPGMAGLVFALRQGTSGGVAMNLRWGSVLAFALLLVAPVAARAEQETSAPSHIAAVRAFLVGWGHESWDDMQPVAADSITVRLEDLVTEPHRDRVRRDGLHVVPALVPPTDQERTHRCDVRWSRRFLFGAGGHRRHQQKSKRKNGSPAEIHGNTS